MVFKPADGDDLAFFLKHRPADLPVCVLGAGSNVIVRDGGFPGCVIRLTRDLARIRVDGDTVFAGGGALDRTVSLVAADHGLGGLGFLCGIPGTVGGAVRMNAGASGGEIRDRFAGCTALDPEGQVHQLAADDLDFSYRHSALPPGWIVLEARLQGEPGQEPAQLHNSIREMLFQREQAQPVHGRTGGSTFKNPPGMSAWKLVDQAGCRGMRLGDAEVSEKHCNFLMNTGQATAQDLEQLGETVRQKVLQATGVELEWEIVRMGERA